MRDGARRDSFVGAGKALSWWQTLYHGMDGGDYYGGMRASLCNMTAGETPS